MPAKDHRITADDIIDADVFAAQRTERRKALLPMKQLRRVAVGPYCTFYFENFETLLFQVQEMLHIERGGEEQLQDELHAYNPLIPQGHELVATVMFEIDDPVRRLNVLRSLTGVENHMFIKIGDRRVSCIPEQDVERTSPDGKTSSVHFVRFPVLTDLQHLFSNAGVDIVVGIDHPNYAHMSLLSPASRSELAKDFSALAAA